MNRRAVWIIVIAGAAVIILGGIAVFGLSRPGGPLSSKGSSKGNSSSSGGGDTVVVEGGKEVPKPNPSNTVILPQDVQSNEPIFIPKDQLPQVSLPPDSSDNLIVKVTGGIRDTSTSSGVVICGPQPNPEYWVEIADGKLGDRTYGMNWTIKGYHGPGEYTTVVGMAMRYPDGELAPFADGKAKVVVGAEGTAGTVRAEFQFREGLVSVSMAYKCGANAPR